MRMDTDEERIRCVLKSLAAELENSQEAWQLARELSGQLEGEPLAQVLHSRLPDADHREAAGKMAAAVEDMYKGMDGQDTGEALALAAARYILSREERENPYVLGLTAVDLVEGRRLLDVIKTGAGLTWSEKSSAFLAYYSVFLRKGSLMASESLAKALERLCGIDRERTEAHPEKTKNGVMEHEESVVLHCGRTDSASGPQPRPPGRKRGASGHGGRGKGGPSGQ